MHFNDTTAEEKYLVFFYGNFAYFLHFDKKA